MSYIVITEEPVVHLKGYIPHGAKVSDIDYTTSYLASINHGFKTFEDASKFAIQNNGFVLQTVEHKLVKK